MLPPAVERGSLLATLLVIAVAGFFLAMGLVALWSPERIVAYFGIRSLTIDGRNEVRAVYGGFGVAIAILLAASLALSDLRSGILLTVAIALLGMALGRVASSARDGLPGFHPRLFFAVELVLAGALLGALGLS